jgi:hypothetical protein
VVAVVVELEEAMLAKSTGEIRSQIFSSGARMYSGHSSDRSDRHDAGGWAPIDLAVDASDSPRRRAPALPSAGLLGGAVSPRGSAGGAERVGQSGAAAAMEQVLQMELRPLKTQVRPPPPLIEPLRSANTGAA